MSESMRELLAEYAIKKLESSAYTPRRAARYHIWTEYAADGRQYWGVRNFYGVRNSDIADDRHLGWLEWDNNELFISVDSECKIPLLLKRTAGIMKFWKKQLERDWPDTPFIIFASYGDNLEYIEEDDKESYYVNMRFLAVRDGDMMLDFDGMENNEQPVIWYCCNF